MSVLFIALPIALLLGGGGMWACIVCIRAGQYDDLDTPAVRMLIDDQATPQVDDHDVN
ncbi:cbb3-type cytochrome oxidase assembly protein CcoS [Neorhodopirellula pilleata]|uniref:Cytochrome oxidase maturation protein cbb3-type n=1 Tax=Neorhodopirellula pilleata TaxID=2714738 RepID=A0A5C6AAM9_9BACT|nr:cbb3-type cytochrome oxidase assembly protein CcoS [Neorhodopirellula pilleata]TWT96417.1 Cytochrome oxidase maturation protein cbb3-type [Neorhodopirellula pilleata]